MVDRRMFLQPGRWEPAMTSTNQSSRLGREGTIQADSLSPYLVDTSF